MKGTGKGAPGRGRIRRQRPAPLRRNVSGYKFAAGLTDAIAADGIGVIQYPFPVLLL